MSVGEKIRVRGVVIGVSVWNGGPLGEVVPDDRYERRRGDVSGVVTRWDEHREIPRLPAPRLLPPRPEGPGERRMYKRVCRVCGLKAHVRLVLGLCEECRK